MSALIMDYPAGVAKALTPDVEQITAFVHWIHDVAKAAANDDACIGRLQITGQHRTELDSKGRPLFQVLERFVLGEREQMIRAAVRRSQDGWNCYVEPRLVRPGLGPKERGQAEGDTIGVFALVIDVDAYKQERPAAFAVPSLVVRSSEPDNEHRWFVFDRLLSADEANRIGKLLRALGGDANTGNPAQPYRLAGTPNYPSADKRKRHGRVDSPTQIVSRGAAYAPDAFEALLPNANKVKPATARSKPVGKVEPLDEDVADIIARIASPILAKLKVMSCDVAALTKGERSSHFFHVTGLLKSSGFTKAQTQLIWEAFPDSAAEKYLSRESWPKVLDDDWEKLPDPVDVSAFFETPVHSEALNDVPDDAQLPQWLRSMNARHCMVTMGSKTLFTDIGRNGRIRFVSHEALNLRYANMPKVEKKSVMTAWLAHPQRYTCVEATFDPNGTPRNVFNIWRGLPPLQGADTVDASGRGCSLILDHMRRIVCCGNEEHFAYLVRWLAHLIQRPGDKPGVAVVLRGDKGVGKDTLGEYVGRIVGPYFVNISKKKQLLGQFDSHLSTALFVQVEELAWQGDKEAEGTLKSLITARDTSREAKGRDIETGQKSFLRVFATSNERWAVPASENERRFFVLDLSRERMQDHAYFAAIGAEMDGVGPAALRKYLEAIDLTGFQVRAVPKTEALADQKRESLTGFHRFWNEIIETSGTLRGDDGGAWEDEPATIEKGAFFSGYERWCRDHRMPSDTINTFSAKLADVVEVSLKELTVQPRAGCSRVRCYKFPPLSILRPRWEARF